MPNAVRTDNIDYPERVDLKPRGDGISWALIESKLPDQFWRLNNLYKVVDEDGQVVQFRMREPQKELYQNIWYNNLILKARQIGFSTFIEILLLDFAMWRDNFSCAVIAHGQREATDLFRKKVLFAYNNLPDVIRQFRPATTISRSEIAFANGSSVQVTVSARSGTFQALHISEFGKICVKYPAKALEIVTGSLQAVHAGNLVFVESTAEGQSGPFFEMTERSQRLLWAAKRLTKQDYRFFFFPWYRDPKYRIAPEDVANIVLPQRLIEYFLRLENEYGIELDARQKAWYFKKEEELGDEMRREHPSYPAEAFEAAIKGAIWGEQIDAVRMSGRICDVPVIPSMPVDTWWDIGWHDYTVIILVQTVGGEIHIVDWYMNNLKGSEVYTNWLTKWREDNKAFYGTHYGPHDTAHHEWGTGLTRIEYMRQHASVNVIATPIRAKQDSIASVRRLFGVMKFDEKRCGDLLDICGRYHYEWDTIRGVYKTDPRHDDASHPADAMQTGCNVHPFNARLVHASAPPTTPIMRTR